MLEFSVRIDANYFNFSLEIALNVNFYSFRQNYFYKKQRYKYYLIKNIF